MRKNVSVVKMRTDSKDMLYPRIQKTKNKSTYDTNTDDVNENNHGNRWSDNKKEIGKIKNDKNQETKKNSTPLATTPYGRQGQGVKFAITL